MEKTIKIDETEYVIRELTIDEGLPSTNDSSADSKSATYSFVSKSLVSPKLTTEEIKNLPFKVGLKLISAVNDLNGLSANFLN